MHRCLAWSEQACLEKGERQPSEASATNRPARTQKGCGWRAQRPCLRIGCAKLCLFSICWHPMLRPPMFRPSWGTPCSGPPCSCCSCSGTPFCSCCSCSGTPCSEALFGHPICSGPLWAPHMFRPSLGTPYVQALLGHPMFRPPMFMLLMFRHPMLRPSWGTVPYSVACAHCRVFK